MQRRSVRLFLTVSSPDDQESLPGRHSLERTACARLAGIIEPISIQNWRRLAGGFIDLNLVRVAIVILHC